MTTAENQPGTTKTVLAIDGGGVRGILPAMILAEIEHRTCNQAFKLFDVIAGTSTGAFVASLAARKSVTLEPMPAAEIVTQFRENSHRYFKRRWPRGPGWFGPLYQQRSVEQVLRELLQDAELLATATALIVPVYVLRQNAPRVHYFNTLTAKQMPSENYSLWQIIRGATAAPAYFPPFDVRSLGGETTQTAIDGGVFANNPAMLGWLHAHQTLSGGFKDNKENRYFALHEQFDTNATTLANTVVVSIGTGFANHPPVDPDKARGWGKLGWMLPLLSVMFEGQSEQSTSELKIAKETGLVRYFERLQPLLNEKIGAGDVDKLPLLEQAADSFIKSSHGSCLIGKICAQLMAAKPDLQPC